MMLRQSQQSSQEEVERVESLVRKTLAKMGIWGVSSATVDPAYAGGDPKVFKDTEDETLTIPDERMPSLIHRPFRADDLVVVGYLENGEPYVKGIVGTMPAGRRDVGNYAILPRTSVPTSANVGIGTADHTRILRFNLDSWLRVASVHFQVTTAEASKFAGVAVYSSEATNQTRLLTTGAVSIGSTGVKNTTLGSAVWLAPGAYWLAWTSDSTTARLAGASLGGASILNAGTLQLGRATNSGAAGVPPTDLDTPIDISLTEFPIIKLQG